MSSSGIAPARPSARRACATCASTDIGFRVPPALEPVREQVLAIVEQLEEFQVSAAAELGIDDEGVPFHVKKEVTSALRRLAPIGLSTDIIWTANARTLRHVIEMRTAPGRRGGAAPGVRPDRAHDAGARRRACSRTSSVRTTAPGCPSTARSEHLPHRRCAGQRPPGRPRPVRSASQLHVLERDRAARLAPDPSCDGAGGGDRWGCRG